MPQAGTDYLAIIMVGGCAGSFARDPDKAKAIAAVARIFKRDFRNYYKLPKGQTITINVIDVTGYDEIAWDESGFYIGSVEGAKRIDRPIERVVHTF